VGVRGDGDTCSEARIVIGGVDEVPVRIEPAEEVLVGSDLGEEAIEEAAQIAMREVEPATDVHGSAEYRKHLTAVLVRRALRRAVAHGR
jgi:CO/xanthine dehydrogenase FAD-binding subunit